MAVLNSTAVALIRHMWRRGSNQRDIAHAFGVDPSAVSHRVRDLKLRATPRHGHTGTPTHQTWLSMRNRCLSQTSSTYPKYGGRGITTCERWLESFENFLADMGERPEGKTIDRIDPGGNYEPSNCRWATPKEQSNNRRPRRLGQKMTREDAAWLRFARAYSGATYNALGKAWGVRLEFAHRIVSGEAWTR